MNQAFPKPVEGLHQLHCADFLFAVLPLPIISDVLSRHCKMPLTLLPMDLFVSPCKIALSGIPLALIQLFEIRIVFGGDSAHAPNPQTSHQAKSRKYVNHNWRCRANLCHRLPQLTAISGEYLQIS